MVQWLGFSTFTVRGLGSIPGWGTKILQASQPKIIYVAWQHHNQSLKIKMTSWTTDNFVMSFFFLTAILVLKKKLRENYFQYISQIQGFLQCRRRRRLAFHPWVGKIPWRRKWQPTYSCWGNPMDRGVSWATVCGVTKSWTQLSPHHHHHKYRVTHLTR